MPNEEWKGEPCEDRCERGIAFEVEEFVRTVTLHDLEELDDDLGARADQDLALAGLLGVVDVVEGIVENGSADHLGGIEKRFSSRNWS
jgi:hypothetical protein